MRAFSFDLKQEKNNIRSDIQHLSEKEFTEALEDIKKLRAGWVNGEDKSGDYAFSQDLLETIKNIAKELPIFPMIFPTYRNSIQLEYEKDDGEYLEFELFEDKRIIKFYMASDGRHYTRKISERQIKISVNKFYAG